MRRFLVIPLLLLVTACGADPAPAPSPSPSPAPSSSPDPEVTLPADYIGASEASEPPAASTMRGAGWELASLPAQAGPLLKTFHPVVDARSGEQTIGNYLIGYAMMRAPEGQEVVVAALGSAEDLPSSPVTVRAGDRSTRIAKLTLPVLVLTVPAGAPVSVTVEDGRPQTLNLRTGVRVERADTALFYDTPRMEKTDGPQFAVSGTKGVFLSISAELVPGLADVGYARKGSAWLAVTVEAAGNDCDLRLRGSSFRFGSSVATGDYRLDMSPAVGMVFTGAIRVAIPVPEKTRGGTLVIAPVGSRAGGDCGTGPLSVRPGRESVPLKLLTR
ncbi:hypothetical protein ACTI_72450 [Actinoplanes sp. OR16]|uniref:hypothetical protein n=1 Tax=Actinoplanes sp. OR16 TaxID=946334 RepID=UPI000F6E6D8A|nr:hypothetical protein [Actinoplanes sp. OR16]BBH70560.1 hypothetical protein ACTI_72450 [Actinoplanes sp. OR16]